MAPHLLLFGDRLAIAQFADSVACHLLLCSGRLTIAHFADSAACHLLLCGGRLAFNVAALTKGGNSGDGKRSEML